MSVIKDLEFEFVPAPFTVKCLIDVKDISFAFAPRQGALRS